jgi:hypothetical protein
VIAILTVELRVFDVPGATVTLPSHGIPLHFPSARRDALAAIKRDALRLAGNGTRDGHKFADRLFPAIPELKII